VVVFGGERDLLARKSLLEAKEKEKERKRKKKRKELVLGRPYLYASEGW